MVFQPLKKTVLFIAYGYPPISSPGGVRVSRIIENLPKGNWDINVLTVTNGLSGRRGGIVDPLRETPMKVIRVKDILANPGRWVKSKQNKTGKPALKKKIIRGIQESLIPDRTILWAILAAVKIAMRGRNKLKIDVVYSTSGPASGHLAAWIIANAKNVPWVAEFRDPLSEIHVAVNLSERRRKALINFEAWVVKRANQIVVVTPGMERIFRERYPNAKIEMITNAASFVEEDIINRMKFRAERDTTTPLILSHAGFLYGNGRPAAPLLHAIIDAKSKIEKLGRSIQMRFIGEDSYYLEPLVNKLGLSDIVELIPSIDHAKSVEEMIRSDCCVILLMNERTARFELSSKYFDYITSGNPILALGDSTSDLAQVLNNDKSGEFFEYDDIQGISKWLVKLAENQPQILPKSLEICRTRSTKILGSKVNQILKRATGSKNWVSTHQRDN